MRITSLLISLLFLLASTQIFGQNITLSKKNTSLEAVFLEIQKQTGYNFFYKDEDLKVANKLSIKVKDASLLKVLELCFESQPLTYSVTGNTIVVRSKDTEKGATGLRPVPTSIKGKVVNELGDPMEGVTVSLKDQGLATSTDANGFFIFKGATLKGTLLATGASIEPREMSFDGKNEIILDVKTKISLIEEVVVSTGYEEIPKERATGSFVKISNELFNRKVGDDVLSRIDAISNAVLFDKRSDNLNIQIRGLFTLTESIAQPLIVVDNFPYEGNIRNINPNDVESVTILKDAAATSIWGARAGNGVIVITMKKGRFNQPLRVSFNSTITVNGKLDLFEFPNLSPAGYVDAEKRFFELGAYDNAINDPSKPLSPVVEILLKQRNGALSGDQAEEQLNLLRQSDLRNDLKKYFYRRALSQQYAVNMSGGGEKIKYFFSVGYDKTLGSLIGNSGSRVSLRSDNSFRPVKKLEIRVGTGYTQTLTRANNPFKGFDLVNNQIVNKLPLYTRLVDSQGNPLSTMFEFRESYTDTLGGGKLLDWRYRPLQELANNNNVRETRAFLANLDINYNFTNALSADIKYQFQHVEDEETNRHNIETYFTRSRINSFTQVNGNSVEYPVPLGPITEHNNASLDFHAIRAQLNFNKTWQGMHKVYALGGFELRQTNTRRKSYDVFAGEVDRDSVYTLLTGGAESIRNSDVSGWTDTRYVSWYGNASYLYNERYLVTASIRKDASNLFGVASNQKGIPLWSAGAGWKLSNENFYHSKLLPYLNMRVTYGFSGNVNNIWSALTTIGYQQPNFPNIPVAGIANYPNPRLRWEKVGTFNAGVDFAVKNKWIEGSAEYFYKKSTDVLARELLDPTVGLAQLTTNSANITGQGIDIKLTTINLNTNAIKWYSSFNINYITYKVSRFVAPSSRYLSDGLIISPLEGYTPYLVVSTKWAGLDAAGDPQGIYKGNISKDYVRILASTSLSEYHISGPALPRYFGNMMNIFSWKAISFSANITYRLNYYFRRSTFKYGEFLSKLDGHADYLKRWQKPGDEKFTNVPALRYPNSITRDAFYNQSEATVERGDHIRLTDIRLSYDLDQTSWKKLPFRQMQFYAYMTNINAILWRANRQGIDPEYVNQIRPAFSLAAGVKVDF